MVASSLKPPLFLFQVNLRNSIGWFDEWRPIRCPIRDSYFITVEDNAEGVR
jgi:hypothetical protein